MPQRERYLFICTNRRKDDDPRGSCAAKGSEKIADDLKLALNKLGANKRVRVCKSSCLDMCETGVSIVVTRSGSAGTVRKPGEPDHVVYGGVRPEDVEEIAQAAAEGRIVERLVVGDPSGAGKT